MAARADQVRDFLHDHPGLAAARACEHQQRAFDVGDRGGLLGIEAVHRKSGVGCRASYPARGCAIGLQTRLWGLSRMWVSSWKDAGISMRTTEGCLPGFVSTVF